MAKEIFPGRPRFYDFDGSHQVQTEEGEVRKIVVGQGFPLQVGMQTAQPPQTGPTTDAVVGKIRDPYPERSADDYVSYGTSAVQ